MTHINIFLFFLGLLPLNEGVQVESTTEPTQKQIEVDVSEQTGDKEESDQVTTCPNFPFC
ncbi:hypothetical protein [Pleionea sediminis]|uniref:hypothetical protein n=1 Tax=Pleionea sediminis TaxID=2569479 RepID=UPI001186FAD4|nr:hypothetical protein [Pleionea sediminis]